MTERPKSKPSAATITRYLRKKAKKKISGGRNVISHVTAINKLKSEVELLTSYSTDTIYRLRYDTMAYDYISPSVIRLLGYTPDELAEINLRSLIEETRIITENMQTVLSFTRFEEKRKNGLTSKWQADYLLRTKDGRKIWVSDISYPWFDKKGAIIGSVGSLRDISDRIAAEAAMKDELIRIANTDSLTGLSVRRVFFERLDDEIRRLKRAGGTISMLLIDVDHFKLINDNYGHDIGDSALQDISAMISTCLRDTDLAGRIGGEEFGVLLPDTPKEGAYGVAQRICQLISKHRFVSGKEGQPLSITVSVGLASTGPGQSIETANLYKLADTRLYIAKHSGRNQVSMDEATLIH